MTREVMRMVLNELKRFGRGEGGDLSLTVLVEALREALAQPVQPDMPAICAALGFDPTNHHNAARCPYCTPSKSAQPVQPSDKDAEIARLTACLKAANASAEKFEREWYLRGDEIEAMQAQSAQEAVYQYQLAGGTWIDQTEDSYKYNVKMGQAVVRILYTSPPQRQPEQEPVKFLAYGSRFKISYDKRHSGKIDCIPAELGGRWVALVAAEDDCHLNLLSPPQRQRLTDEMVVAAARMLSDRQSAACNVDCGDMWKLHGNDFIEDARAALEAADGIGDKT